MSSQKEIRLEQWKYIYSAFPLIDLPFAILSIVYSQNWLVSLCLAPLFPIIGGTILKLSQKRNFYPGAYIYSINGAVFVIYAYIAGPNSPSWLMLINIAIGCSFLFRTVRLGQILFLINIVTVSLLYLWMGATVTYSLIIFFTILSILILFSRTYDYLQLQQLKISKKNEEIEYQKNEIIASINYAKRIQSAILPSAKTVQSILPDSFIMYEPKDIVAGDFYWLKQVGDTKLIVVADCTGHGVPGALVSVVCHNALNNVLQEGGSLDPADILDKVREKVIQEFEKSTEDVNDGMDIAFCSIQGDTLQFAGANNPLWIIRDGELLEWKGDKQPIAKFSGAMPFASHQIKVKKGDRIFMFTDGYADQFGGENNKKFKRSALKQLLLKIHGLSMDEQKKQLEQNLLTWMGNQEQVDDICILGFQI